MKQNRNWIKASAPGRLDVMGGIADYSGAMVLQMPIRERTTAALKRRADDRFHVVSEGVEEAGLESEAEYDLRELPIRRGRCDWAELRRQFEKQPGKRWALYALGCLLILNRDKGLALRGMDVRIRSRVPLGKSVSSSAALEVAVMTAMRRAFDLKLGPTELPVLCQRVENEIVGAPCGLMDQLASYLGRKGRLLPILCQPDRVQDCIPIPRGLAFLGLDSGVRHAVSGASYTDVRVAAFMGFAVIAGLEGATRKDLQAARRSGDWSRLPYRGYLANIPLSVFEARYQSQLPEAMSGKEFTDRYGLTTDLVTEADPNRVYRIRACARHPVCEQFRVGIFISLLRTLNDPKHAAVKREELHRQLGELMYQSHAGYTLCGLGNEWTDRLVEMVRERGPRRGLYGAKITGGGSGGTICVLARGADGRREARKLFDDYCRSRKQSLAWFSGSGEGAYYESG